MTAPIALETAIELVLQHSERLEVEAVALDDALGRTLARDVVARFDLPRFANSAMDGFAVRAQDTVAARAHEPAKLQITTESRAGRPAAIAVGPGCAARISTGAVMPAGADAVVRLEDCQSADDQISISSPVNKGDDLRPVGDDLHSGTQVLAAGAAIGAGEVAMLATVGLAEVDCFRRPRVAILATGDELRTPGEPLGDGQIYDSNSHMTRALARQFGSEVTCSHSAAPDNRELLQQRLRASLADNDLLIVCGGVSVGPHDLVKPALIAEGVEQVFWQVALRPGHPTWFGVMPRGDGHPPKLVFGLPGNAVSAYVTFLLFVRPALIALAGNAFRSRTVTAILDQSISKRPGDTHALRVSLEQRDGDWRARLTALNQRSHAISSLVGVDGLAILSSERGDVAAGETVQVELLEVGL